MTKIEYPFDDGLEPALKAYLSLLRKRPLTSSEEDEEDEDEAEENERIDALTESMPSAVRALAHTAKLHGSRVDLGWFEFSWSLETLFYHNCKDEIEAAVAAHGFAPTNVLKLGETGGGEVNALVAWMPDRYAFMRWDMDTEELEVDGTFGAFLTAVADYEAEEREMDQDSFADHLKELMVDAGLWDDFWNEE